MKTNTPTLAASDAALLAQIRTDASRAAELVACLAQRATQIAATADPSQTTLANLVATAQSVADQARSASEAILMLTTPATNPGDQPPTEDTVERLAYAGEWATMLRRQLNAAVNIHALICAELSDRAAVAEEWNAKTNEQPPSPANARTLATYARLLRDSAAS